MDPCLNEHIDIRPGMVIHGYTILSKTGSGYQGTIWKSTNSAGDFKSSAGDFYALKVITIGGTECKKLKKEVDSEIKYLERLTPLCGNVNCYKESFVYGNSIILVSDFINGKELDSYKIHQLPENWVQSLMCTLYKIHSLGVVHADIKGPNILLDEDTQKPVFVDFGLSMCISEKCSIRGTPRYIAPEIIDPDSNPIGLDIFALGITILFILLPDLPFPDGKLPGIKGKRFPDSYWIENTQNKISMAILSQSEKKIARIVSQLIEFNPEKRIDNFNKLVKKMC